jgi:glucose-1-phosphate thymidylyltransferase
MIGILLAGGNGSRLYPLTNAVTKHILPIYDKPVIYYSLSILMLAGIRNIIIIGKKEDIKIYKKLLSINKNFGLKINFLQQNKPEGILHALIISKKFIKKKNFCLLLGDNFFYGDGLIKLLYKAKKYLYKKKSIIFTYGVKNPEQYGVAKFKSNKILEIIEKPISFISNQIIVGLYFYRNETLRLIPSLKKSFRGEYEITDFNNKIIKANRMKIVKLGRGIAWYDVGSFNDLLKASNFINSIQDRQGVLIASPEEIAYNNGWLKKKAIMKMINNKTNNSYINNLKKIL